MPRRRCVGCGRSAPKSELLRIAADREGARGQTRAVSDPLARISGRGAYLCLDPDGSQPDEQCVAQATRRGGIARALRRSIPGGLVLDDSKLVESVGR